MIDQVYHVVLVALNQEAQIYKLVYQWLFPLSDSTNCVSLTKGESNLMCNSKVFTQHLALAILEYSALEHIRRDIRHWSRRESPNQNHHQASSVH